MDSHPRHPISGFTRTAVNTLCSQRVQENWDSGSGCRANDGDSALVIDVFVGNFGERFFYDRLYTVAGPLSLPTVVRGTVVLNAKCYSQSGR